MYIQFIIHSQKYSFIVESTLAYYFNTKTVKLFRRKHIYEGYSKDCQPSLFGDVESLLVVCLIRMFYGVMHGFAAFIIEHLLLTVSVLELVIIYIFSFVKTSTRSVVQLYFFPFHVRKDSPVIALFRFFFSFVSKKLPCSFFSVKIYK